MLPKFTVTGQTISLYYIDSLMDSYGQDMNRYMGY